MDGHLTKKQIIVQWFMPTAVQVAIYVTIVGLTIFLSSQDFIDQILFSTGNFNPIRSGIGFLDNTLQNYMGERIAGALSLAVFWGFVGLLVNIFWWIGSSFSTELNNDLVYSRYVHPQDIDPKSQLRELVEKTVIRTTVAFIGIGYINYFLSKGLPNVTSRISTVIAEWSIDKNIGALAAAVGLELLMLHMFVVLTRLVLLRKKTVIE